MYKGKIVLKLVTVLASIICSLAMIAIISYLFFGIKIGFKYTPVDFITSPIWLGLLGENLLEPLAIYSIIAPLSLLAHTIVMFSMFIGIIKGSTRDKWIIIGASMTTLSVYYEVFTSIFAPNYVLLLYFASNLPELIRTTIIARKKIATDLIKKDQQIKTDRIETINSMIVTYNHEIRNPLAIIKMLS